MCICVGRVGQCILERVIIGLAADVEDGEAVSPRLETSIHPSSLTLPSPMIPAKPPPTGCGSPLTPGRRVRRTVRRCPRRRPSCCPWPAAARRWSRPVQCVSTVPTRHYQCLRRGEYQPSLADDPQLTMPQGQRLERGPEADQPVVRGESVASSKGVARGRWREMCVAVGSAAEQAVADSAAAAAKAFPPT